MKKTNYTKTRKMKKYVKLLQMDNSVDPAAHASVWGKGVPGKGGATRNFAIPSDMFKKERAEMKEGGGNA